MRELGRRNNATGLAANRASASLQLGEFATARTMLEREASQLRAPGSATPLPPMIANKLMMTYQRLGLPDSVSRLASALLRDSTLGLPPSVMLDAHVALADAALQSGHAAEAQREAAQALDSLQRFIMSAGYKPGTKAEGWLAPVLLRASAYALATGDNARAAAFAKDARAAASLDALAATQSALVGEALAAEARAMRAQNDTRGARDLATKALTPLRYGYGDRHPAVAALERWIAAL